MAETHRVLGKLYLNNNEVVDIIRILFQSLPEKIMQLSRRNMIQFYLQQKHNVTKPLFIYHYTLMKVFSLFHIDFSF